MNRYEDTLKLTKNLLAVSREQTATFESFGIKSASFPRRQIETVTRRCLLALHIPFMPLSFINPSYSFSRQIAVETAIELIYSITFPAPNDEAFSHFGLLPGNPASQEEEDKKDKDILRLYAWGSGPFRSLPWQCFLVIASEILAISHGTFGEVPLFAAGAGSSQSNTTMRMYELKVLLQRGVQYMERRLQFVEATVKDYILFTGFMADIEAHDQMDEKGLQAYQHAASILRGRAGAGSVSSVHGSDQDTIDNTGSIMDDFWIPDFSEDDWNNNLHINDVYAS